MSGSLLTQSGGTVVPLGELRTSSARDDALVTYSLGSCVGLALYDPVQAIAGLVHCMLPVSSLDPQRAVAEECVFTDLGVMRLLQTMFDCGVERENIVARVAGGASMNSDECPFNIGERNCAVLRRVLWRNNILLAGEDTGGSSARTMKIRVSDGRTIVRTNGISKVI